MLTGKPKFYMNMVIPWEDSLLSNLYRLKNVVVLVGVLLVRTSKRANTFLKCIRDSRSLEEILRHIVGEMDYTQLRETVLDPRNRVLNKITLQDCEQAAEELIKIAMGKDAEVRRIYIEENSNKANLLNL